jgi:hypothetical protein
MVKVKLAENGENAGTYSYSLGNLINREGRPQLVEILSQTIYQYQSPRI